MNKRRRYKAKARRRVWLYRMGRESKRQAFGRVQRCFDAVRRPRVQFNPRAFEIAMNGLVVVNGLVRPGGAARA